MASKDIIVVGASAGGFEALKILVAGLPPDLPASVFVVWHMSPEIRESVLPQILQKNANLPARQAADGEPIRVEGEDELARCLEHETDHLDGIVYIHRLDRDTRRQAMKAIRSSAWFGLDSATPPRGM